MLNMAIPALGSYKEEMKVECLLKHEDSMEI
jgi:hypothetical protein